MRNPRRAAPPSSAGASHATTRARGEAAPPLPAAVSGAGATRREAAAGAAGALGVPVVTFQSMREGAEGGGALCALGGGSATAANA
jgi:hypothetical protein